MIASSPNAGQDLLSPLWGQQSVHPAANLLTVQVEVQQDAGGDPLGFAHQSEHNALAFNVVVPSASASRAAYSSTRSAWG